MAKKKTKKTLPFGDQMRIARGKKTQDDVADDVGISQGEVSATENGKRDPRISKAVEMLGSTGGSVTLTGSTEVKKPRK